MKIIIVILKIHIVLAMIIATAFGVIYLAGGCMPTLTKLTNVIGMLYLIIAAAVVISYITSLMFDS